MSTNQPTTDAVEPAAEARTRAEAHTDADAADLLVTADSDRTPTLSVIMPTLNEEDGIGECLHRIRQAVVDLQVPTEIVVSDSSTDRTPDIARDHGAIVVEPDQPGYGYAYRYAFKRARGDYIAIGDADTTYDFTELPKLYALVESGDADMAMGSRLNGEIKPGAMPPLHRYIGNPLLTKFLNVFYGAGVSDAHSGMRVFSRDALEEMDLQTTGMEFASEMIMEAGASDLTIREEPITYHEREGDATIESFRDGWRHVRFMLLNAPGYLFSVPGFLLTILGTLIMGIAHFGISLGGVTLGTHSMIGGSLLTLVGFEVLALGVFATVAADPVRKPSDPVTTWLLDRVQLEHGASVGALVAGVGGIYMLVMFGRWVSSGFTQLPLLTTNVLALTAIVFGLEVIFSSFFLSAIGESH
ncbi:glycosyltransferase family 2 protein [Haloplanus natans]|uniref:glycosyltransferase family 2 protein n=1 Tax=Haloplanus natans TaxID=376171 RepID=UPI000677D7E6